ncbi:hypothetical protein KIN20_017473 [Parelaphostrongylus tenuis]|uniref:Uncharacterized protein n=1 Tax=Parelaphostrongylus tenuis TaxID=148309 RepID=A0AAD5N2L7_PARTN|nr:hypothetical protein KIN20_017473 [Parelaphostrongylus tenuis]
MSHPSSHHPWAVHPRHSSGRLLDSSTLFPPPSSWTHPTRCEWSLGNRDNRGRRANVHGEFAKNCKEPNEFCGYGLKGTARRLTKESCYDSLGIDCIIKDFTLRC